MKGLHKKMNWIALSAEQLDVVRDLNCAKHNFAQKAQPFLHFFTKFQKPCLLIPP